MTNARQRRAAKAAAAQAVPPAVTPPLRDRLRSAKGKVQSPVKDEVDSPVRLGGGAEAKTPEKTPEKKTLAKTPVSRSNTPEKRLRATAADNNSPRLSTTPIRRQKRKASSPDEKEQNESARPKVMKEEKTEEEKRIEEEAVKSAKRLSLIEESRQKLNQYVKRGDKELFRTEMNVYATLWIEDKEYPAINRRSTIKAYITEEGVEQGRCVMFVTQNKPTALKYLGAIEPLLNHELYFESNNVGVLAELATNSDAMRLVRSANIPRFHFPLKGAMTYPTSNCNVVRITGLIRCWPEDISIPWLNSIAKMFEETATCSKEIGFLLMTFEKVQNANILGKFLSATHIMGCIIYTEPYLV